MEKRKKGPFEKASFICKPESKVEPGEEKKKEKKKGGKDGERGAGFRA